jgi:RHS repeat-associated protein
MNLDHNKKINSITYNHLNLPVMMMIDEDNNTSTPESKIEFIYDAAGIKLRKITYKQGTQDKITDYIGGMVYEDNQLQFIPHPEGRWVSSPFGGQGAVFVPEYHYKDHLGNLRVSVREGSQYSHTADFEAVNNPAYTQVSSPVRQAKPSAWASNTSTQVGKLNTTNPLGAWKSIKVTKGDKVMATAKGFYINTTNRNDPFQVGVFVGNIPNPTNPDPDSGNSPALLSVGLSIINMGAVANTQNGQVPKAYLRAVFYDNSPQHNYLRQQTAALNAGANIEQLLSLNFEAETDGLLQVFVANVDVYFDNVTMSITEDLIVQENHYYPFGMNLVGIEKQGEPDNRFQYNGKEKQTEFNLNLTDFGNRMQDPQLGRFHVIDRFAEKYYDWTGYQYGGNNPIKFVDIRGDSLDVALFRKYDSDATDMLMSDIKEKSGLILNEDETGNVTYSKNEKGKAIVSRNADGKKIGSRAARKALIKLIDSDVKMKVDGTTAQTNASGSTIYFNVNQTMQQMNPNFLSKGLNPTTFGYALTFFHELGHTDYGGKGEDPPFVEGENAFEIAGRQEKLPNKIRRQLGVKEYGQRMTYLPLYSESDGVSYFPWSQGTYDRMKVGEVPQKKYIIHPDYKKNE